MNSILAAVVIIRGKGSEVVDIPIVRYIAAGIFIFLMTICIAVAISDYRHGKNKRK